MFYYAEKPKYMKIDWTQAKPGMCIDFTHAELGTSGEKEVTLNAKKSGISLKIHRDENKSYFFVDSITVMKDGDGVDIVGFINEKGRASITDIAYFMRTSDRNKIRRILNNLVSRGYLRYEKFVGERGGRPTPIYYIHDLTGQGAAFSIEKTIDESISYAIKALGSDGIFWSDMQRKQPFYNYKPKELRESLDRLESAGIIKSYSFEGANGRKTTKFVANHLTPSPE